MLQFVSPGKGACRITGAACGITAYAAKAVDAKDLLLLSKPEETPAADKLSWPGEYDVAGVTLRGIGHGEGDQVSWLAVADGYRIALPSRPLPEFTDAELEHLGDVHVLVVAAEDPKKVQKMLEDIDPRILILIEGEKGIDPEVLRTCGAVGKEHVSEYKLKGSMPAEGREIVVLTA